MRRLPIALLPLALAFVPAAHASFVYTVTMDTTSFIGSGPFTLDFQFVDGTGLPGDLNNNSVSLTNFAFGAGGPLGGGTAIGGASGSLGAGISLHDTGFFNEYLEDFTPGAVLSFDVSITNVLNPSGTPDLFTMAILDSGGFELPTTGVADEFLGITLGGGRAPSIETAGSARGSDFPAAAPTVQAPQTAVPEPSSLWLLAGGACSILPWRRWTRASPRA